MIPRNVLGQELEPCGTDPVTGFLRTGACEVTLEDQGLHGICAVMTEEFLAHQVGVGNDLVTPRPELAFPGLRPGDRWCVVALRWRQALEAGVAPPVVLRATHEAVTQVVPFEMLAGYAVDVPDDPSTLITG